VLATKQMGSKKGFPGALLFSSPEQHIYFTLGFSEHEFSSASLTGEWGLVYATSNPKLS